MDHHSNRLVNGSDQMDNREDVKLASSWESDVHTAADAVHEVTRIFKDISLNIERDDIVKTANDAEAAGLKKYGTPGPAHSVENVLQEAFEIFNYRMRMNHPRFFGFIPGPASPFSWLGESVTSAFNTFSGSRLQGSGPGAIETELIHWMASKAGLPLTTAGGLSVSGGSMANLTAMVLARDHTMPCEKWSLGVAYVSDQTHSSVAKGLRILGFQAKQIHKIPSDEHFQMDVSLLKQAIQSDRDAGLCPFVIIASCGTTNTGSVDPLHGIVDVGRQEGLWIHVDGAYGASALLSESRAPLLDGLGGVDSISWDAHKWLFQTYGCGVLLVRDKEHLAQSFHTDAEYIRDAADGEDIPNFWNLGLELTRPARIMKLWFTLRILGVEKVDKVITHGCRLAEAAEMQLRSTPDWEVTSAASLAIVTFRFVPGGKNDDELDALNDAISKQLVLENVGGILTTKVKGKVVLRICALSPLLTESKMKTIIQEVDSVGRKVLQGFL